MALEKEEYLWRMVNEHMTQARHQESLRSLMTTILVSLSSVIVGFITFDKELTITDLAPSFLLIILGTFGAFFSAKHYERFNFHIARVRSYRNALEKSFPDIDWSKLRDEADKYHEPKFPRLVKQRQHKLWLALHCINALLGVALFTTCIATVNSKNAISENKLKSPDISVPRNNSMAINQPEDISKKIATNRYSPC